MAASAGSEADSGLGFVDEEDTRSGVAGLESPSGAQLEKSKKSWNSSAFGTPVSAGKSIKPEPDAPKSDVSCPHPLRMASNVSEILDISWPSFPAAICNSSVICCKKAFASSSVLMLSICCSFLTISSLGCDSHSVLAFFGEGALLTAGVPVTISSSSRGRLRLDDGEGADCGAGSGVAATATFEFLRGSLDVGVGFAFGVGFALGDLGVLGEAAVAAGVCAAGVAAFAAGVEAGGVGADGVLAPA